MVNKILPYLLIITIIIIIGCDSKVDINLPKKNNQINILYYNNEEIYVVRDKDNLTTCYVNWRSMSCIKDK